MINTLSVALLVLSLSMVLAWILAGLYALYWWIRLKLEERKLRQLRVGTAAMEENVAILRARIILNGR